MVAPIAFAANCVCVCFSFLFLFQGLRGCRFERLRPDPVPLWICGANSIGHHQQYPATHRRRTRAYSDGIFARFFGSALIPHSNSKLIAVSHHVRIRFAGRDGRLRCRLPFASLSRPRHRRVLAAARARWNHHFAAARHPANQCWCTVHGHRRPVRYAHQGPSEEWLHPIVAERGECGWDERLALDGWEIDGHSLSETLYWSTDPPELQIARRNPWIVRQVDGRIATDPECCPEGHCIPGYALRLRVWLAWGFKGVPIFRM